MPNASLLLTANTASAQKNLEDLTIKINLVGKAGQTAGTQASSGIHLISKSSDAAAASMTRLSGSSAEASAAVRALDLNFGNSTRTVARFAVTTLGLGPILSAAFPVIGGLFFADMIVKLTEKVHKFFQDAAEGPDKTKRAFLTLNTGLQETADALGVTNAKLENQIAKLQGRPENNLKVALFEARVEADKLALSLENDNNKEQELLEKHKVGRFASIPTGMAPTTAVEAKLKRFRDEDVTRVGQEQEDMANATDLTRPAIELRNAQREIAAEKKQRDDLLADLDAAKKLQLQYQAHQARSPFVAPETDAHGLEITFQNPAENIAMLAGAVGTRNARLNIANQNQELETNRDKLAKATAAGEEQNRDRPYQNKLDELKAQLQEVAVQENSIGKGHAFEVMAQGAAEATKAIADVNEKQKAMHLGALTPAQEKPIRDLANQIANKKDQEETAKRIEEVTAKLKDETAAQKALDAAIGQGFEKSREAAIQAASAELLKMDPKDPRFAAAAQQIRPDVAASVDAKRGKSADETIQKLQEQTKLENDLAAAQARGAEAVHRVLVEDKERVFALTNSAEETRKYVAALDAEYAALLKQDAAKEIQQLKEQTKLEADLAAAQSKGAEVVRQATLDYKLRQIALHNNADDTALLTAAEIALYNAGRLNASSDELNKLKEKIAATQSLTAAVFAGAEAQRKAALESKYAQMRKDQVAPEVIAAAQTADQLEHQQKITEEAGKLVTEYDEQQKHLSEILAVLEAQERKGGDILQIQRAIRDVENQQRQSAIQEDLKQNTAGGAVDAFFLNMQDQAKNAGKVLYDSLNNAVDGVSDQLAKLMTGQKADWGKMLQQQGEQMAKSGVKGLMDYGLGKLGGAFGIHAKADGSKENPWHAICDNLEPGGQSTNPAMSSDLFNTMQPPNSNMGALTSGLGGAAGGLGGFLSGLFGGGGGSAAGGAAATGEEVTSTFLPMLAEGGDVDPGRSYIVGDGGESEVFSPKSAGRVTPISKMGGDTHYHFSTSVDARGAELGVENRVRAEIAAAHASAVSTAVQANAERAKRTPQRKAA